ncbi:MAG TPA: tetratricopeptide repeat protein [Anaerolineales bacterium]
MAKVSLRAYNREIEAMIDRNHLDEAIAHCRHILKSFPKHLETYRLLGKAYLEYKRYPEAVDIFSRVLVVVPNDFVSNVGMSIIRDEENKLDEAIWHMERAFETQPSNAAIQSELQRLYGRRDGVQLPRIRMTHGALAHMYVKGELYPQAISEIKNVLKEDPGRADMQVLLARAYYRSGARNDAAEVASSLLRSEPYNLDANRILVEILGVDHPESVQAYRQRVIELDPYAAQVSGSMFLSDEVPEVAVSLERLDWNGQPVGLQPDWQTKQAISLEGSRPAEEEPDWLKNTFSEPSPRDQGTPVAPFDAAPPSAKPAEPVDDIPDFLRSAGWGQSTGAFDESKSPFVESEPASDEEAIAPGDLPDWVKAMAPEQPDETPSKEEDLPDWINKIGTSALPVPSESTEQPDWLSSLEQPERPSEPAAAQPDWLNQLSGAEQPVSSDEQPDWLKGFENESASSVPSTGELDWLDQLSQESKPAEAETQPGEFDVLSQSAAEPEPYLSKPLTEEFDFLKEIESPLETTPSATTSDDFDFLNELTDETEQLAPASTSASEPAMQDNLGMSSEEQDDSFAWLESLAAKQGATEGLLTKPEERLEEEPDWVKKAKGMEVSQPTEQPPVTSPADSLEDLGKTEQEQDDSFAWLESLAAKQGATEGLLTEPEERLEEEPEWVRQAKTVDEQPQEMPLATAAQEEPEELPAAEPQPAASLQELGRSEEEQEDSFAWLESLAAKQGATEGLLTTAEERPEEEPEWVRQAKDVSAEQLSTADQPPSLDETAAWLRSLDEEEALPSPEPVSSKDDTAMWFKSLEESQKVSPTEPAPEAEQPEDLPAWMQDLVEDKAPEAESTLLAGDMAEVTPELEPMEATEWMSAIEQESVMEAATEEEKTPAEEIPSWLSELDQEQEQAVTPTAMDADLPAWLRDANAESPAEPTPIEPTRPADWQPVETREPEREVEPSELEPEPVSMQAEVEAPVEIETAQPEPAMAWDEAPAPQSEAAEVVNIIEEKIAAVQGPEPFAIPPAAPRERKLKGTGRLNMPIDPILGQARNELSGSNLPGALQSYDRLIKKGRYLDEVIHDLRDALYRFPVDVDIWQSLGDAYMRANRLQDALDSYTKAEELLR